MTSQEFTNWTTPSGSSGSKAIIECSNVVVSKNSSNEEEYKVSVKTPDGKVETKVLTKDAYNTYFNDNLLTDGTTVDYKYNTSSFSINLKEFFQSLGITKDGDIISVEINDSAYRGVYSTSVFMLYKKDGITYGKTFNFGVGYITSFDHYYRYYSTDFNETASSGENIYPTYYAINGGSQNTDAGSLTVKLPEYALNLQSYKDENFTIDVEYEDVTMYYRKGASVFGTDYYEYVGTCKSSTSTTKTASWSKTSDTKIGSYYSFDFGSHNRIAFTENDATFSGADYFVNSVQIKRIVIKDKDGNILIAKYPSTGVN